MSDGRQRTYEELADRQERKGEARQRDVFLTLAADAAFSAGHEAEAERLRARILQLSPHHVLQPFPSFAQAVRAAEIQKYLGELRRQFPPEEAEKLLANEAAVPFKFQEPAPPRQARWSSKSPYDVPAGVTLEASTEGSGPWIILLLFLLVLSAALGLLWWSLLRPLL